MTSTNEFYIHIDPTDKHESLFIYQGRSWPYGVIVKHIYNPFTTRKHKLKQAARWIRQQKNNDSGWEKALKSVNLEDIRVEVG